MNSFVTSLGEHRALAENDCDKWSPREMLEWMLREMDNGSFNPAGIVVSFFYRVDGNTVTGMRRSKVTVMEAVAMCEMAKHDLLEAKTV